MQSSRKGPYRPSRVIRPCRNTRQRNRPRRRILDETRGAHMRPFRTLAGALLSALALAPIEAADQPARAGAGTTPTADKQPAQARRIDVAGEAAKIDALVDAGLKAHALKANPELSDEAFLRRIYLDAVGRIPTLAEYKAFLDDPTPKRRAALIAKLLGSDGWVSREFNWWADLLRVETQLQKRNPG